MDEHTSHLKLVGSPWSLMGLLVGSLCLAFAPAICAQSSSSDDWRLCEGADPRPAVAACSRLLAASSSEGRARAYLNRANAFDDLGQPDRALADYDSSLSLSRDEYVFRNKGVTLYRLRRFNEAIAVIDSALAINPRYAMAWIARADVFFKMAPSASDSLALYRHAIANYDTAFAIGGLPARVELTAYVFRSTCHRSLQDFPAAIGDLTSALRFHPDINLYLVRARTYADNGDAGPAQADVDTASALTRTPTDSTLVRETREYVTRPKK